MLREHIRAGEGLAPKGARPGEGSLLAPGALSLIFSEDTTGRQAALPACTRCTWAMGRGGASTIGGRGFVHCPLAARGSAPRASPPRSGPAVCDIPGAGPERLTQGGCGGRWRVKGGCGAPTEIATREKGLTGQEWIR